MVSRSLEFGGLGGDGFWQCLAVFFEIVNGRIWDRLEHGVLSPQITGAGLCY
jgi:hypothetical protein